MKSTLIFYAVGVLFMLVLGLFYVPHEDLVMHVETARRFGADLVYGVTTRELNPPLFYFYLKGPIFVGDLLHVWPGYVHYLVMGLLFGFSAHMLLPSLKMMAFSERASFGVSLGYMLVFGLSQNYQLSQKEAMMAFLCLPGLLLLTCRAVFSHAQQAGVPVGRQDKCLLFLAGVGVLIKPHFALVLALPLGVMLWTNRAYLWRMRGVCSALLIIAIGYGAVLLETGWLRFYADNRAAYFYYGYMDLDAFIGLSLGQCLLYLMLLLLWWVCQKSAWRFILLWAGVGLGLWGGAAVQLSGVPYHYLPFYALISLLMLFSLHGIWQEVRVKKGALVLMLPLVSVLVAFVGHGLYFYKGLTLTALENRAAYRLLKGALEREKPPQSFAYIGQAVSDFQILSGLFHLSWGLRTPCLWGLPQAAVLLKDGKRAEGEAQLAHIANDVALDLVELKPDLLAICRDSKSFSPPLTPALFMASSPALVAVFKSYEMTGDEEAGCRLYQRKSP